jgi:recombination protein RecA
LTNDTMDAFLEKLDPKTRKRFKMAQEVTTEMLPSASLEFNWATGGGFPRGAITTVYGNYSSSKTALTLATIANLQKMGLNCAFIDAEKSFKKDWAVKLGVDLDKLILIRKASYGAIVDEIVPLLQAGLDFLVWDSISLTLPEQFVDEKGNMNEFGKQKQIGADSRSAGVAINAMHYVNEQTAIVLISQTRTDMSGMHPMQKPTGGKAVEFGSAIMARLQASGSESQQIKGKLFIGDKIHELPVGREVKIDIVKNKVGPPSRTASYKFYYADSDLGGVGIDNVDELVSLGKRFGVIRSAGAWVYYEDLKWNGNTELVKALKADDELFQKIQAHVEMITTGEVKDEQQLGEVQEAATSTATDW